VASRIDNTIVTKNIFCPRIIDAKRMICSVYLMNNEESRFLIVYTTFASKTLREIKALDVTKKLEDRSTHIGKRNYKLNSIICIIYVCASTILSLNFIFHCRAFRQTIKNVF
jgi:hypothetical protein